MYQNIKKYVWVFFLLGIISCSSDNDVEPLFDEDVDARTQAKLDEYKAVLLNSEFGWKTAYQPENTIGVFNVYLNFDASGNVAITSDYNEGETDLATTYRVGIAQVPELVLENYSAFHSLFEANRFSLGAEFEFLFEEVLEDRIVFKSKTDAGEKSTITFIKANANDQANIKALQGLDKRIENGYLTDKFFRSLTATNASGINVYSANFSFDSFRRIATVTSLEGSNVVDVPYPIVVTANGFNLLEPITIDGNQISEFVYDEDTNNFVANVNGIKAVIAAADQPGLINDDVFAIDAELDTMLYRPSLGNDELTSPEFRAMIAELSDSVAAFGLTFFEFRIIIDLDGAPGSTLLQVVLRDADNASLTVRYALTPTIEDKRLKFEYLGPFDANSDTLQSRMQPLIDFFVNPEGLLYESQGTFANFSNLAGRFVDLSNSKLRLYGVWL